MFCSNCGEKTEEKDLFCGECGTKVERPKEKSPIIKINSFFGKLSVMPKNKKIKTTIFILICIFLVSFYFIFNFLYSPKTITKKYLKTLIKQDYSKIYDYLYIKESEFTTKDIFVKINYNKKKNIAEVKYKVDTEYEIMKYELSKDKTYATVYITYKDKDAFWELKLIKDKKKKFLLFDNWKVINPDYYCIDSYKIEVFKDSKVFIEGLEVNKKYIDQDLSNNMVDVYVMPYMFGYTHKIVVELPFGENLKQEDKISVSKFGQYKNIINKNFFDEDFINGISNSMKETLKNVYTSAMNNASFEDFKKSYTSISNIDLFKVNYEKLIENLNNSSEKLNKIEFKNVLFKDIKYKNDGTFSLILEVNYDFDITFSSFMGESQSNSSNSRTYITFILNKDFNVINIENLVTYFSRYR